MRRRPLAIVTEMGGLQFWTRPGTSDYNTANACAREDEYELADVDVAGKLIFDIGAHIGGVAVWLASRGAISIAVEPIPENAELIRRNADLNDVMVHVVEAALGDPPQLLLRYRWNGGGREEEDEIANAHAFIGNTGLGNQGYPADTEVWVKTVTLSKLIEDFGVPAVVKTDCEGGEWSLFEDPRVGEVPLIVGEWHDMAKGYREEDGTWIETETGHFFKDIAVLLGSTHDVTFSEHTAGAGGFRAVRR